MLDGLKPYSEYKDSGDRWIGAVPAHWAVDRLKKCAFVNARTLPETTPPDYRFRYLDIGAVATGRLVRKPLPMKFEGAPSRARRIVRQGDTIISTVRTYLKAVYTVSADDADLIASTGFAALTPKPSINAAYLSYAVQSEPFVNSVVAHSTGIAYPAIAETLLARLPIVYPPPPAEQAGIVRFLGAVDRKVGRFIRAKRRLIEVLTEQKQAIITHAVTKGLSPHSPLKPSGIDWEIPAHWEMLRAKYLFREVDERSVAGTEKHLSMSQRHGLVESDTMDERRLLSESYIGGKLCRKGDLVLNRLKAHLGVFAVAPEPGVISPDYTVLRPLPHANVFFYALLLRSNKCRPELRRRAKGIVQGFWRLYTDDFYDIRLPVPSLAEQVKIVAACEESTLEVNRVIETTLREIDLIREYRTRLVADVVTGKLDVRGVSLPDDGMEDPGADHLAEHSAAEDEEADLNSEPESIVEEAEA